MDRCNETPTYIFQSNESTKRFGKRCIPIVKGRLNINDMWRHMGQSVMGGCVSLSSFAK